jgi:hypothetical protein
MSYIPNLEKIQITDNVSGESVIVESTANASLVLNADTDNDVGEVGSAHIQFKQDASAVSAVIGTVQTAGQDPLGNVVNNSQTNALYIGTEQTNSINFATNDDVKLRIDGNSSVIEQIGNQTFVGQRIVNLLNSAESVSYLDGVNRNNAVDSSIHLVHRTDGGSAISFFNQTAGTFADRRSIIGRFTHDGVFQIFNSVGTSVFSMLTGRSGANAGFYEQYRQTTTATDGASDYFSNWGSTGRNVCRIRADGNLLNFNNSYGSISDVSLKENIQDAPNYLEDLCNIKIKKFSMKADNLSEPNMVGVIAQELEEVFPKLVEQESDGMKSVKYSVLVPILVKSVQELKEHLDEVKSELDAVKAELAALKG